MYNMTRRQVGKRVGSSGVALIADGAQLRLVWCT